MALSKTALRDLYRKRADWYDISANLYYLIGFRETRYRKMAVSALQLDEGDTVVDLGCGTGLNFKYLLESIGNSGKLIGVDLTDAMLEKARSRVDRSNWQNIELIQCDAAEYTFPAQTNGIISSFAFTLMPEYENVIAHAANRLTQDGHFVLLDFKQPEHWPLWTVKLAVLLTSKFGVTLDLAERKPWLAMQKYFRHVTIHELYGGFTYIAIGTNQAPTI